ncbi:MAG: TolC family protein [Bacteroidaceae bacterium]|nr:TolC family protein [Bacteroidaceae bacterium]
MKKISKLSYLLLLLGFSAQSICAQEYADYMNAVEKQNATYLAERYNVSIAEAQTAAARVFNDPTLSVEYGNNQDWSLQMGQTVDVGLSYLFNLGNVRRARINVARSEEEITRAVLDDWFRNLKADATIAWVHAQEARALKEIKRSSYESMIKVADNDSIRASLGDGSLIDARQSRVESKALYAEYLAADAEYANALQTLSLYAGGLAFQDVPEEDILLALPSSSAQDMVELALENRADLRSAELSRTLSERNLALVKASRAPEFELSLGYSYNKEVRNEIAPAPTFHGLSIGVSIPLKFSRLNKGERLAAERTAQQAEAAYEAAKQQIVSEVQQALVSWRSATKVAQECSATMLEDATSILENRRIAYLQGDSSLLDYLMAVRVYNDTAEQCIAAKAGLVTATAELLRAIGL